MSLDGVRLLHGGHVGLHGVLDKHDMHMIMKVLEKGIGLLGIGVMSACLRSPHSFLAPKVVGS